MLLELARWLHEMGWMPPLFGYITFRGILGALTALLLSLWLGPAVIARLAKLKGGQPIRTDGPQSHFSKAGTPTMGGALILLTITLSTLLWADLRNRYVWVLLAVMVAFGAIGWYDDWIKIVRRDPNGLKSRWKYLLQSIFGLAAGLYLYLYADVPAANRSNNEGSMFKVGERWVTPEGSHAVTVKAQTATGFVVTVGPPRAMSSPLPPLVRPAQVSASSSPTRSTPAIPVRGRKPPERCGGVRGATSPQCAMRER